MRGGSLALSTPGADGPARLSARRHRVAAVSLALYRKYRPATFAEVVGQEHVTEPLQQALRNDKVHHAYLFSGPRGCGKTSSARILARALNCEQGPTPEPCGTCRSCVELAPNGPGSIDVVEIDAASHGGVDDARDLREKAFFAPVASRFKIYVVDEAHMVSPQGFNALLKLVEEPPDHLKFIFATTEPEKVLQTIRSRTHHYPFRLMAPRAMEGLLRRIATEEQVSIDDAALALVVRAGAGSARDSLSVLDQLAAGSGDEGITYALAASLLGFSEESLIDEVVDAFAAHDAAEMFATIDRVVETGHDPRRFAEDLLERLRDLLVLASVPDAAELGIVRAPADKLERLRLQAGRFGAAQLTRAADVVNAGLADMKGAVAPRLLLEIVCARVLLPGDRRGCSWRPRPPRPHRTPPRRQRVDGRADGRDARTSPHVPPRREDPAQSAAHPRPARRHPTDHVGESSQRPAVVEPPAPAPDTSAAAAAEVGDGRPDGRRPRPARTRRRSRLPARRRRAPAAAGVDVQAVRQMWPEVVERVKEYKRVTWMLLMEQVQVASVDDRVLVLAFGSEGKRRNFSSSGHDEIVRQALIDVLGLDRRVDAVLDPSAAAVPAPAARLAARRAAASRARGSRGGQVGRDPCLVPVRRNAAVEQPRPLSHRSTWPQPSGPDRRRRPCAPRTTRPRTTTTTPRTPAWPGPTWWRASSAAPSSASSARADPQSRPSSNARPGLADQSRACIAQTTWVPDSDGAVASTASSRRMVKPRRAGTPRLASLARSWWISMRSTPGRVKPVSVSPAEARVAKPRRTWSTATQ